MAHHASFSQFVLSVDGLIAYEAWFVLQQLLVQIEFCGEGMDWVQTHLLFCKQQTCVSMGQGQSGRAGIEEQEQQLFMLETLLSCNY